MKLRIALLTSTAVITVAAPLALASIAHAQEIEITPNGPRFEFGERHNGWHRHHDWDRDDYRRWRHHRHWHHRYYDEDDE